jgi:hypothetical protein
VTCFSNRPVCSGEKIDKAKTKFKRGLLAGFVLIVLRLALNMPNEFA